MCGREAWPRCGCLRCHSLHPLRFAPQAAERRARFGAPLQAARARAAGGGGPPPEQRRLLTCERAGHPLLFSPLYRIWPWAARGSEQRAHAALRRGMPRGRAQWAACRFSRSGLNPVSGRSREASCSCCLHRAIPSLSPLLPVGESAWRPLASACVWVGSELRQLRIVLFLVHRALDQSTR